MMLQIKYFEAGFSALIVLLLRRSVLVLVILLRFFKIDLSPAVGAFHCFLHPIYYHAFCRVGAFKIYT